MCASMYSMYVCGCMLCGCVKQYMHTFAQVSDILYIQKYWRSNKLAILFQIRLLEILAGFLFGGKSTSHTCIE